MLSHRVLLADGDETLLAAYREYLAEEGFVVSTVKTGLECVESVTASTPDVLVLDPALLAGWGEGILGVMVGSDDEPWLRVVALAAGGDDAAPPRFASYPVSAWCAKPVAPATLARRIREVLQASPRSDLFVTEWTQPEVTVRDNAQLVPH